MSSGAFYKLYIPLPRDQCEKTTYVDTCTCTYNLEDTSYTVYVHVHVHVHVCNSALCFHFTDFPQVLLNTKQILSSIVIKG